eukprot:s2042_g11.t1
MPCVRQFYASDSTYVWQDASGQSHEVRQSEGGEPGDPLMPALYAIAQHAALAAVHAQLREGEAVFPYPDDINVSQFSSASGNCRTPANGHFASTRLLVLGTPLAADEYAHGILNASSPASPRLQTCKRRGYLCVTAPRPGPNTDGPRNLPLGLADLGCARQTPIVMPRTGPFGSDHGQQSVLVLRRSPTTSCMRSPRSVPVAQLRSQRQRKPTTSLLKAATSPLGTPQSQRTHTSTTSQGTVSEAGSGTPPALESGKGSIHAKLATGTPKVLRLMSLAGAADPSDDGVDPQSDRDHVEATPEVPPGGIAGEVAGVAGSGAAETGAHPSVAHGLPPGAEPPEEPAPLQPLQKPEPAKKARQCCGGRCSRCPGASLVSCCFSWTLTDVKNFLVQIPQVYCETLARRPWAFLLLWAIAVLIVLPMMWRPIVVNADIDAFRRADAPAARGHLAYLDALKFMRAVKNESALGQRTMLKVEILYEAKDGSVFSESVLRDIRAFEQSLRSLAGWSALCNMSEPALQFHCNPGDSMGNYVWPRRLDDFLNAQGFFRLAFDGSALERLPMDAVIAYLSEGLAAPHDLRMFLPMTFAEPSSGSKTLRSVFGFAAPDLNDTAFREAFQDFVQNELYSSLLQAVIDTRKPVDPSSWDQPPAIRIYFRGDMLDEHELLEALYSDMLLAIGPLFISLVVAWVKLRSALLALVGTTFLCLAALLAYIILPVQEVSPASLLGIFLLFGLGFSSIFRMQEVWRRSRNEAEEHSQRLLYVHWAALREMLPVAGSAICYVLLRDSKLVPLREFGVFIGTSIFLACAFALLCFVPFLLMPHRPVFGAWLDVQGRVCLGPVPETPTSGTQQF